MIPLVLLAVGWCCIHLLQFKYLISHPLGFSQSPAILPWDTRCQHFEEHWKTPHLWFFSKRNPIWSVRHMPFLNLLSWWISIFTLTPSLCLYVNSIKQQYQVATKCILMPHEKPKEHLNSLHGWNFCLLRIRASHRNEKPSNTLRLLLAVAISSSVLPWLKKTYSYQPTKLSSLCN